MNPLITACWGTLVSQLSDSQISLNSDFARDWRIGSEAYPGRLQPFSHWQRFTWKLALKSVGATRLCRSHTFFRLVPHFRWLWWKYGFPGFTWFPSDKVRETSNLSWASDFCLWIGINLEVNIFPSKDDKCGHVTLGFLALPSVGWKRERLLPCLHQWIGRIWEFAAQSPLFCGIKEQNRVCLLPHMATKLYKSSLDLKHVSQGTFFPTQRPYHFTEGSWVGTQGWELCPTAYNSDFGLGSEPESNRSSGSA